jgi:hypothetical protein
MNWCTICISEVTQTEVGFPTWPSGIASSFTLCVDRFILHKIKYMLYVTTHILVEAAKFSSPLFKLQPVA